MAPARIIQLPGAAPNPAAIAAGAIPLPGSHPPSGVFEERVEFVPQARAFVGLTVRGALLQLVTFGFYRFWLTTDVRRYLWSHTSAGGDAFEYTGRGRELLIGFLLALAVLAPIYLGYFLLGIELERARAFASFPLFLLFFFLAQFALYRARRYRLTRTIWRGVRFWMTGSGWSYALRSFLWGLLALLTLGLAYPWRAAALERYKMRHTRFGNLAGAFTGTGGQLFRQAGWIWALFLCPLVALILGLVASGVTAQVTKTVLIVCAVLFALTIPALPFLWPVFRAIEWRWWANGLQVGEVRVSSDLRRSAILTIYLQFLLFAFVVFAIPATLIGSAVAVFGKAHIAGLSKLGTAATGVEIAAVALIFVVYLATFLAIGVVQRFYLQHEVWRVVAQALHLHNLETADDVRAEGLPSSAFGEGLADGLDFAGF